jgi:hypothetical protein
MSHFIFKNSYQNVTRLTPCKKFRPIFFFLPLMFCSLDYKVYNSYLSNMSTKHCTFYNRKVYRHECSEYYYFLFRNFVLSQNIYFFCGIKLSVPMVRRVVFSEAPKPIDLLHFVIVHRIITDSINFRWNYI